MANVVVVGLQWGDEGKGKVVDLVCPAFGAVVRYQGGHNAGHTVRFGNQHFALRLIPSGILHDGLDCLLGNGMVVEPDALFEEIAGLEAAGVEVSGRLYVSRRAHAILPHAVELDRAREAALGASRVGTTGRGIGPTYELKAARLGVRLGDLGSPRLEELLRHQERRISGELAVLGAGASGKIETLLARCRSWAERLEPLLVDGAGLLHDWIAAGRSVLFEGAQGSLLDLDHGTYPFVTSSNPTVGGACTGTGVPPGAIQGVLGVVKAYTTRVGGGPFPGELLDEKGDYLRRRGNEFGTVTGRPRRCGWFDAVAVRHAVRLNGVGALALTKIDVLDAFEEIPICVAYRWRGQRLDRLPEDPDVFAACEPEYEWVRGWRTETGGILAYEDLPEATRAYVERLESLVGAPVALLSTGPRREETVIRHGTPLSEWLDSSVLPQGLPGGVAREVNPPGKR